MDKRIIFILILLLGSAVVAAYLRGNFTSAKAIGVQVRIGTADIQVEVADTPAQQSRGLSGRETLEDGQGMLFVFDPPRTEVFWMYQMLFPIDIIWIQNDKVIGLDEQAPAPNGGAPARFSSPGVAAMVLEVPAGTARRYGIAVGAPVEVLGYTKGN